MAETTFNPKSCKKCRKVRSCRKMKLKHGRYAGTLCKDATPAMMWDCVKSYPARKPYNATPGLDFYVCWNWAREATSPRCCLTCAIRYTKPPDDSDDDE